MPIYEYECEGCHRVHEVMQKFSDAPLAVCPDCGKSVHKIMSRTSFALKGTGWYSTDYKKSAVPPPASPTPASSPAADSKPAAPVADGAKAAPAAASGSESAKSATPASATPASSSTKTG